MEKICWQITVAAFMQPIQYDLRSRAAKDNSITNAATARSNLDAAITMRSAETELQNTIELRATASEIVAPTPTPCVDRTCTKHRWNPICGTGPTMIRAWSDHDPRHDPTTHETVSHPSHRRGRSSRFGDGLCIEKHRVSCICYQNIGFRACAISQKRISCETSFKTPSATPPRPHTRPSRTRRTAEVNHRGSGTDFVWKNIGFRASAISQKRTLCETSFKTPSATPPPAPLAMPFALRERSYSCKSQWNSIGNSSTSTTCNHIYIAGTILQLQITMEFCRPHMHETQVKPHLQCGTDPSMIRPWSEHDPTTHETVSHPSHRRGRSSRFGDGLCMEKHRVSCICYLSKTHFVRDFLQKFNLKMSFTINSVPH